MSIVEKAAEKLKALSPEPPASPHGEPVPPHHAPPPHPAATIERLQERARTAEQAAEPASACHLDRMQLERRGMLPRDDEASGRLADELRRIKRPLLGNANGRGAKALTHPERIVITSAVPGEGKTFTAVNLALSLARERDFEVLLVDGDVPKSDITRTLGLSGQPGLMDVLEDDRRRPAEVIVPTDVPNLSVVPAGRHHQLASELFGSLRMEHVLGELGGRTRRRLLVFDSSPLLATSEAQVLASHMGQVIVVVAAGNTSQHEVNSALENLDDSQYIGLILNMSRLPSSDNPYYKYYGYSDQKPGDREGDE